ncbi:HAMP domain-containing sensor histidine kinase [Dendrosporobacter sp. 1207_IL3150]|uniref:HAMP domain-containing sensor histidine kinase n=1 Tax=Dendrosporobacter sp. 1207_IL3150 TaxID=3084054 RepID=UPI002FDB5DC9
MKWWYRYSIYSKINLIIVGTLLFLSLVMALLMQGATRELLERQIEQRGYEVASYIAALSVNDILLDNEYSIFERINKAKDNNKDVRYILISSYTGKIIVHTFAGGLPEGLPLNLKLELDDYDSQQPYKLTKFSSNEGPVYEILVPIENGNVGFVRVGMSDKSTSALLDAKMAEFSLTAVIVCLIAVVLASWLASVIIKPIRGLAHAAEAIKNNNYSVQANYNTEDEIGQLATAFNGMAASLKQKEQENNQLLDALRAKELNRTVLLNKLFTAQEDERRRLSRELHDGAGQSITSILAYLRLLLSEITDINQRSLLNSARDVIVGVLSELRQMAVDLRPPVLDDLGLVAAIEKYLAGWKERYNISVHFNAPKQIIVPDQVALALYRILQEGMTNIIRHAKATNVEVRISIVDDEIRLIIIDDGCGFSPIVLERALQINRLGLYGMKERAELLNGTFSVESSRGKGTIITTVIPLTQGVIKIE